MVEFIFRKKVGSKVLNSFQLLTKVLKINVYSGYILNASGKGQISK